MTYVLRIYGFDPATGSKACLLEAKFLSYKKAYKAIRTHAPSVDRRSFPVYYFSISGPRCGKVKELKHGFLWEHQS